MEDTVLEIRPETVRAIFTWLVHVYGPDGVRINLMKMKVWANTQEEAATLARSRILLQLVDYEGATAADAGVEPTAPSGVKPT